MGQSVSCERRIIGGTSVRPAVNDADELIAEDRHRRIHKHRDGDPECKCLECNNEDEGDEDE